MFGLLLLCLTVAGADLAQPLSESDLEQAKAWIEAMKVNERGPYSGVMWFCADGQTLEPKLYACVDHGGGKMHGVLSPHAEKLGGMGIHVGTVLASLPLDALTHDNYYRARALIIESYLERALHSWVLKTAKTYRGFRQAEDEEENARWLLIELARREDVLSLHRLLLVRLIRAMPYGAAAGADEVRALASVVGDADPRGFGDLRFKIHSMPEPADIELVEAYVQTQTGDRADKGRELAAKMREYYDPTRRLERLEEVRDWLHDRATKAKIDAFLLTDPKNGPAMVRAGTELIVTAAAALRPSSEMQGGERNLLLLHVMAVVEELWIGVTADFARRHMARREALELVSLFLKSARSLGWLSARENEAARAATSQMQSRQPRMAPVTQLLARSGPLGRLLAGEEAGRIVVSRGRWADPEHYAKGFKDLSRVLEWGRARLLADLGMALARYQPVEPRSAAVIDDQLRSSVLLPLAALLDRLSNDVEDLRGGGHTIAGLGQVGTSSLRGENAGLATGALRILGTGESSHALRRHEIVLLHGLPPELPPVAGIMTVGNAGFLSHVSLLARNLGIPHATVGPDLANALEPFVGQEIALGVSATGRVVLGPVGALPANARSLIASRPNLDEPFLQIDEGRLDLATKRIHMLAEISEKDSGVIVGPKAAELGRLKRLFPDRVSDAAVIPFGAFLGHVSRPGAGGGGASPLEQLRVAYAHARALPPAQAEEQMLGELERFRTAIADLPFVAGFEEEVVAALARLGEPEQFGVFVRSDTNVEDLKKFTGAGLNLTVPNRVRNRDILAAIRAVWASPFTERSFRWRQRLLVNPQHVYPSVILHRTVPSELSGVLVTADLETGAPDALTVSASEGVAAVVDGGAPETIVIEPDGACRLLASPRSATCKAIPPLPAQGVVRVAAQGRDPLLTEHEIQDLRRLAKEIADKIPSQEGLPWDIEFGFFHGRAFLMQIRPLRTSRSAAMHPLLCGMDETAQLPTRTLDLSEALP